MSTSADLGPRFRDALHYSAVIHYDQSRKGGDVPYVGHLLGVAAIVIEEGGSEDEVIAALLHDVLEDQSAREKGLPIKELFGPEVYGLVVECSDLDEDQKRSGTSAERKAAYIKRIPHKSPGALLISLADKLYNARSILLDLHRPGADPDDVFSRFHVGKAGTLQYYDDLLAAFEQTSLARNHARLVNEFADTVRRIHEASGPQTP